MEKEATAIHDDIQQLADDARALVAATADVAGDKVGEARQRLAAALERGKHLYGQAREKAIQGCEATDAIVHRNPYQAIAIGVGLGAVFGYLIARRGPCNRE
jgi:ElaB/YqjD/DUF883 family membrane-anchored ribosome-binding protein